MAQLSMARSGAAGLGRVSHRRTLSKRRSLAESQLRRFVGQALGPIFMRILSIETQEVEASDIL